MLDDPELIEMKRKANTQSLKEMAMLLRGGSRLIWIAPSGGRDRPDPTNGEWFLAPFGPYSVDNIKGLLTILAHQVEKEMGEKRVISFHGTNLSVAPEISFSETTAACESPEKAKDAHSKAVYISVNEQYNVPKFAIHDKKGLEASTHKVSLSQPWN
ncbi:hypothetical protein TanjilG_20312 [Lupinus angustifolius]|uniref:Uncharacterized protein n=1 Tax=Lupinus angustifolius TaxID=3871 RepID=A0A1J7IZH4_LUPAN|nr:hypothetical protein TanjilG_20312 [Lupinus angustifolius]